MTSNKKRRSVIDRLEHLKKTSDFANKLKDHSVELGIETENVGNYWHIKKYKIDYKKVFE